MSLRLARPINVFWQSLLAAAVLLVVVPPLIGGCVFFLVGLTQVLGQGQPFAPQACILIWALVTGGTLLMGADYATYRLCLKT